MKQLGLVTAVIATLALTPSAGLAQQKTLYVAGYGGSFEKTIRDAVIPDFEKANGVKVEYVAGNSTDTLAKLQAQKGNQQIDVAIVDDGPMYQAIQLGFCGKIEGESRRRGSLLRHLSKRVQPLCVLTPSQACRTYVLSPAHAMPSPILTPRRRPRKARHET